jgi:hypothetical protein
VSEGRTVILRVLSRARMVVQRIRGTDLHKEERILLHDNKHKIPASHPIVEHMNQNHPGLANLVHIITSILI